jgi:endonuclease G
MKLILPLLFALTTTQQLAIAGNSCDSITTFGTKPIVYVAVSDNNNPTYLCRKLYVLEHSPVRKTAFWVAEHIYGKDLNKSSPRINAFKADPDLPKKEAATPSDYKKSGYDQGHMAAVGNMHQDPEAMLESFYLSNMVPQHPENNRNGWNHLESYIREMAQARGDLYTITGPIYKCDPCETIGKNRVQVPTHLYKIIVDPRQNVALSFIVPNIPFSIQDAPKYITTLSEIEQVTNIRFFPNSKPLRESKFLWTSRSSD